MQQQEEILVLDLGGGYSQVLARMVRAAQVYSRILPSNVELTEIQKFKAAGIILAGGPESLRDTDVPSLDIGIFELGIPILGIGYGMEVIASELSADLKVLAGGESTSFTVINEEMGFYGLPYQPGLFERNEGQEIIRNFLFNVCQVKANWNMKNFIKQEIELIREKVGSGRVISGLSGGVDSAVASALVHKAIGDQLICIFVDHGMLRKGEAEEVRKTFADEFQIPLIYVDAKKRFLDKLAGVQDPEQKRKIIGEEFIRVFEEEAQKIGDASFLVQGTLYSDIIESGDGKGGKVKSHHNVGGLPEDMDLQLIEPLRELFKDEVRELGEVLGLPEDIVWRQPFPGPGLAVRIIGTIDEEKLAILREADAIFREEIREAGLNRAIWQYFAVLPDIKSVGVKNNQRTYAYPIILRAVTSKDAMTADWARIPHEVLERISNRIISEVDSVNRVVYDITSKPPGTIEWE